MGSGPTRANAGEPPRGADDGRRGGPAVRRRRGALPEAERLARLDAMADYLLAHGLSGSPLRALAAAAGTSDRMLLYDFADKDELLAALLAHVAERVVRLLEATEEGAADAAAGPGALLARLWAAARSPAFAPYLLLFLELAAAAGRGEEPHRSAAGRIADRFTAWVAARLGDDAGGADGADRDARAALLLATLDGLFLLHSAGRTADADAAARHATGVSAWAPPPRAARAPSVVHPPSTRPR